MAAIPVFVFPNSIEFSSRAKTSTVSLYNPYDFSLRFSVLATNPNAISLSCAEGVIRSRHCLDLAVRLKDESISGEKLLIRVKDQNNRREGQRELNVSYNHNPDALPHNETLFTPIHETNTNSQQLIQKPFHSNSSPSQSPPNQTLLLSLTAISIVILLLPHETSGQTGLSSWLSVGVAHKLVVSYVLGILTVLLLRH